MSTEPLYRCYFNPTDIQIYGYNMYLYVPQDNSGYYLVMNTPAASSSDLSSVAKSTDFTNITDETLSRALDSFQRYRTGDLYT